MRSFSVNMNFQHRFSPIRVAVTFASHNSLTFDIARGTLVQEGITLQEKPEMTAHSRSDVIPAARAHQLAPNEPKAPIAILTPAKRATLIVCLNSGGILHKQRGVWITASGE